MTTRHSEPRNIALAPLDTGQLPIPRRAVAARGLCRGGEPLEGGRHVVQTPAHRRLSVATKTATGQGGRTSGRTAVPTAVRPDDIRNVVLVGPAGSGKTTLIEALLVAGGVLTRPGSVVDGTTVSDHDESEHKQQRSTGLALAPLLHDRVKVNLLDTPGYADFVGELRAGLRSADCAMFVLAADQGVDTATRQVWQECTDVGMPRVVVVTRLDHARADYPAVVAQAQVAFGERVLPVFLPDGDRMVGLFTGEHGHEEQRAALIEGVIEESEDETLMDRYLAGEEIDRASLVADLERAVARGTFFPVVPVDATSGAGATDLLDLIVSGFPSPLEHPMPEVYTPTGGRGPRLTCDSDGPFVAEVVKTSSDPCVGRVSLVRVFSGTLRPDMTLHVSGPPVGHRHRQVDSSFVGSLLPPLSTKDPQIDRLARELARATGESLTAAVAAAVRERLERVRGSSPGLDLTGELTTIARRCAALPVLDDRPEAEILGYDEHGLPV